MVAGLMNVDRDLASKVAQGLGIDLPEPLPRVLAKPAQPEVTRSECAFIFARPGDGSIRTRRIALLVADGVDATALQSIYDALSEQGAVPNYVGHRLGAVQTAFWYAIEVEVTMETAPAVVFDALVLPSGKTAIDTMLESGQAMEFIEFNIGTANRSWRSKGRVRCSSAGLPRLFPTAAPIRGCCRQWAGRRYGRRRVHQSDRASSAFRTANGSAVRKWRTDQGNRQSQTRGRTRRCSAGRGPGSCAHRRQKRQRRQDLEAAEIAFA